MEKYSNWENEKPGEEDPEGKDRHILLTDREGHIYYWELY